MPEITLGFLAHLIEKDASKCASQAAKVAIKDQTRSNRFLHQAFIPPFPRFFLLT